MRICWLVLKNFSILKVDSSYNLGLCGPVALEHPFSGWELEYCSYSTYGNKRRGGPRTSIVLRYAKKYGKGDTVGCGINMQTRKMFFTKNGITLGEDCPILLYTRNCFLGLKSLTNHLQKVSHSVM